jgi:hypothetical protein
MAHQDCMAEGRKEMPICCMSFVFKVKLFVLKQLKALLKQVVSHTFRQF